MSYLLLALLACGHPESSPARVLVARWEADPEGTRAAVEAMPPGPEKIAAIETLAEAWPAGTGPLCAALPDGPERERCHTITTRPHLWQIDRAAPSHGKLGSGKVFPALVPSGPDPWTGLEASPGGVGHQQATVDAWEAAMHGRTRDAARACLRIEAGQWREECFFQAAERSFEPGRRGDPGDAARLCLGAGPYASRCLGHLSVLVASQAPAACVARGWAPLGASIGRLREALTADDRGLAERLAGDSWARSMARAYGRVDVVSGDPLTYVEPAAIPHVRAAVAWRLLQREGEADLSLDGWVTRLEQALSSRAPCEAAPVFDGEDTIWPDRWPDVRPGEAAIPRVSLLGGSRRALGARPQDDDAICVLEAAALDGRAHARLWASAASRPDPLVRWTLARLAPDVAGPLLAEDPDPRVRDRALHP